MNIIKHDLDFIYPLIPLELLKIDAVVYHHTESCNSTVESVHEYHRYTKGWNGIGYNYLIYKDGSMHEGRGFNIGAQSHKNNSHTVGISFVGNFNKEEITQEQVNSGIKLSKWLITKLPNIRKLVGHNHFNDTDCPGITFPLNTFVDMVLHAPKINSKELIEDTQQLLNKYNFSDYDGKELVIDGIIGERTLSSFNKYSEVFIND